MDIQSYYYYLEIDLKWIIEEVRKSALNNSNENNLVIKIKIVGIKLFPDRESNPGRLGESQES